MLVLSRRIGETLRIADDILVTIVDVKGNQVRLGIDAPAAVTVLREELVQTDHEPLNS
jgi:carbon storage regulator